MTLRRSAPAFLASCVRSTGSRVSFWPRYVRPNDGAGASADDLPDFDHVNRRIAGWKRYPERDVAKAFPQPEPEKDGTRD